MSWKWCVGWLLLCCAPSVGWAADGELMYGKGGVQRLRQLYQMQTSVSYGPAPQDVIKGLIKRADTFLTTTYSYKYKTFQYTMSSQMPAGHKGDNFPYWTAMFQERADSITTRINTLTFAFLVTQDQKYRKAAQKIVEQLAAWKLWSDPDYTCYGACLDTGHITFSVGYFYDAARSQMTASEKLVIRTALADKGLAIIAKLAKERWLKAEAHNLHAIFAMGLGVGAAAIEAEDTRAAGWMQVAIQLTEHYLKDQGADGGLIEYHGYGAYAMDYLVRLLAAVSHRGQAVKGDVLKKMSEFYLASLAPDGSGVGTFGDSWSVCAGPTMLYLASLGDAYAQAYLIDSRLIQAQDYLTVGWARGSMAPKRLPPVPWSSAHVGLGILRSNATPKASLFLLKSGPPKAFAGHNQLDHLTFNMWAWGSWLLGDPGYSKAGSQAPPLFRFYESALGHNTILLHGQGPIKKTDASLAWREGGEGFGTICGEAAGSYAAGTATSVRRCATMHPKGFVVLSDRIETPKPMPVQLLFQPPANGIAYDDKGNFQLQAATAQLAIRPVGKGISQALQDMSLTDGWPKTLVVAGTPSPAIKPVTLSDGGFEASQWKGWSPRSTTAQYHSLVAEAHVGRQAAKIDIPSSASDGYLYSDKIPVKPGEQLLLSGFVKTKDTSAGARLRLIFWKSDKTYHGEAKGEYVFRTWPWHKRHLSATVPTGASAVTIALELRRSGTVWFDQIQLQRVALADNQPTTQRHATLLFPMTTPALNNGDFRFGMLGWRPRFRDGTTHSIDANVGRTAAPSGSMNHTRAKEAGYFYSPFFSVKTGDAIEVVSWLKLRNVTGRGVRLIAYMYDATNKLVDTPALPYLTGTKPWTRQELKITVPQGVVRLFFAFQFFDQGQVWFDDITYENKSKPIDASEQNAPKDVKGTPGLFQFTRNQISYVFADAFDTVLKGNLSGIGDIALDSGIAVYSPTFSTPTVLIGGKELTTPKLRIRLQSRGHVRLQTRSDSIRITITALRGKPMPTWGAFTLGGLNSVIGASVNRDAGRLHKVGPERWLVCWGAVPTSICPAVTDEEPLSEVVLRESVDREWAKRDAGSRGSDEPGSEPAGEMRAPIADANKGTDDNAIDAFVPDVATSDQGSREVPSNNGCGCQEASGPHSLLWCLLVLLLFGRRWMRPAVR